MTLLNGCSEDKRITGKPSKTNERDKCVPQFYDRRRRALLPQADRPISGLLHGDSQLKYMQAIRRGTFDNGHSGERLARPFPNNESAYRYPVQTTTRESVTFSGHYAIHLARS